ncbi:L,D-transpeptidase [Dechloromonas sp. H13]|uniref:L,D-transpeptidase family protein n=1 Tax=Dechloromonas sp. H13 TaxID=2570193 RepID=UPI00129262C0|nr:L,D-transpeptidase family protein [Dechloromonas sp. H13]
MSSAQPSRPLTAASRQLLVVVAAHWESRAGRLRRFARAGVDGGWQPVGDALAVSLGRAGLAWGRGLHPPVAGAGPLKREGDGRSPAGVFAITALFGDADSPLARTAKLPYLAASAALKAVDDPASAHYNRIVDLSSLAQPDWTSCEDMLRADGRYAIGAVVAHNADPPLPGAGSCIFLHVWECAGAPTAGCTAMSRAAMSDLAGWLDGAAAPLLVQLPQAEYERKRADWALPPFIP